MANDITEDDIEVSLLNILKGDDLGYNIVRCDPGKENKEKLNDGTGRSSKRQCVLPKVVRDSLYKINPSIPKDTIDKVVKRVNDKLCKHH